MKDFLRRYSYGSMKMFLDQFAIAIFGLVLALAAGKAENDSLQVFCSAGAVLFYLFLLYTVVWEIGSKDKLSVDYNHIPYRPLTGLWMALLANSINLLLAVLISLGFLFADGGAMSNMGAGASVAALLLEGMYTGLLTLEINGAPLNSFWWSYFVIILPALGVSVMGYLFGLKDMRMTRILLPKTPEEIEESRDKKKQ